MNAYIAAYTVAFLGVLFMLIILIAKYKNRVSIHYFMFFTTIILTDFGYLQLEAAHNLESAIHANQVTYLGGCFFPLFMLLSIADLCKTQIKRGYQYFLLAYAGILYTGVLSIGKLPIYYKDISFVVENGHGRLIKEYGPLHVLYPIYILGLGVIGIALIINSFRKKQEVSYITSTYLIIFMSLNNVAYILERILSIKIELIPFSLLIACGGTLFLIRKISMYEVTAISTNSMVESLSYGFVICDSYGKYLGSDEAAKIWFPEINGFYIDYVMEDKDSQLLKQIWKWIRNEDERDLVLIEKGDCIYEAKHTVIKECKHHSVHCIYLRDDTEQQKYTRLVENYNEELEHNVEEKTENIRKIQGDILLSMASIVENRDSNTGGHIVRTSDIVNIFVDYLMEKGNFAKLDDHMAKSIVKAAPLHDFGKIAIPDVVLNKPGKFTGEEFEQMKMHAAKGAVIVEQILRHSDDEKFKKIAINVAHSHHEKWNGKGYPEGISGEQIPFEARVMALADVFDALVSKRVYKESLGYDEAFKIIEESSGTHFDPDLCKAFLECRPKLEALYNSYTD